LSLCFFEIEKCIEWYWGVDGMFCESVE